MGERDAVERLVQLASVEGFGAEPSHELDEALNLFAATRLTPLEGRALEALLTLHAARRLPEGLLVPLAAALVDRGDHAAATKALADATSPGAMMLRAELLAKAGRIVDAVQTAERVLLRDIDWPGARERHARWQGAAATLPDRRASSLRPPSAATDTTGRRSLGGGPFRILREVARGGTGTVYEAEDVDLGRPLALKVYHQPERDRAQLLHEARVAVSLAGPGVVRVFDVDLDRGWLAMPWAPLGALAVRIRTRDDAVLGALGEWVRSLASALARVHSRGWVHHDVKPANVLLDSPARALLTDFATARRLGEAGPPGSRGYVSPERLAGRASDPRDDVFGFGRLLETALDAADASAAALPDGDRPWDPVAFRALARACTGPDAARPADGAELLRRLGA